MTFLSMVSPSPQKCSACDMMTGKITQMKNQFNVKVSEIKNTLNRSCQGESAVIQAKVFRQYFYFLICLKMGTFVNFEDVTSPNV